MSKFDQEKKSILAQFKEYAPQIWPFFNLDQTIREYSDSLYNFKPQQEHLTRQALIKEKIDNKLSKLFGDNYQPELKVNLDNLSAISIVDHHQVFNHPYFLSPNIIGNAAKLAKKTKQDAILVFSSGDIPPNTFTSEKGFVFNDQRVPLFSNREREFTSYYIPKREFNFVERLRAAKRWSAFNSDEQKFLEREQQKFDSFDYSRCADYTDQISVAVKNLWPYFFTEDLRANLPEIIYVTQEELVTECLLTLLKEDNFISQSLFDPKLREQVITNFRGLPVTWQEEENRGTHFFWRKYPDQPRSLRLYLKGDKLVPADQRFKDLAVNLDKNEIIDLLERREIYPNLFLIFTVLNFYAGIKPLVGFGSLVYLDFMKKAWIKTLQDSDFKEEIELINSMVTDGLTSIAPIFFKRVDGQLKSQFANDVFYEGGIDKANLDKVLDLKVSDLVTVSLPLMYYYCAAKFIPPEKKLKVSSTPEDIAEEVFSWL